MTTFHTLRLVLTVAVAVKAITFVLCGMSKRTSAMLANSVWKFSPLQSKYSTHTVFKENTIMMVL